MTLNQLKTGESAKILNVGADNSLRQHFLDMGLIPGETVKLEKLAPMGDPMELRLHHYELTLRLDDAKNITIQPLSVALSESPDSSAPSSQTIAHPGLGEEGKYHVKTGEEPLPKDTVLTFALAGNQNCGKTTLFNQLTGSNQHVGNFPGVTVDRKSGPIKGHEDTLVTDLPGIYSLSPYTGEEIVSREFLLDEKPCGIINIVDATAIERNLYLTLQLMELNTPMVLALNMMDEVRGNGGTIDINKMEDLLGIPVVPIAAAKNEGVGELVKHLIHVARYREKPGRTDFCDKDTHNGAVHRTLHSVMHLIEDHAEKAGIPVRFAASKIIEGDHLVEEALGLTQNEKDTIEHLIVQMEEERGLDRAASVADMRYSFIHSLCRECVVKPRESREHIRSRKADRILTGKFTALPSFILIMGLMFYLTFGLVGPWLQGLLKTAIDSFSVFLGGAMESAGINETIISLVRDGIIAGVGTVISFLPIIILLFLFLSLLEDSGYMARVAFITDKLLRKIGLSGRSIVPMLVGFGCTVPGVMASRTLPSARDRKMTVFLTPFMSCTAKLPVYAFLAGAFFKEYSGLVIVCLYVFSILIGILTALVTKGTVFKGEAVPFVMELPNYRMPGLKNVLRLLWEKAKDFIQRAFTIIFVASLIVWFLQSFNFRLQLVSDSQDSILALIAGFIAPVFKPLGFGSWQIVTALIAGFMAKESVVSTMIVLGGSMLVSSPQAALSLLVFCLLYTPCIAAITAVRKELGGKWALIIVVFQCTLAWVCAFGAYNIALLF